MPSRPQARMKNKNINKLLLTEKNQAEAAGVEPVKSSQPAALLQPSAPCLRLVVRAASHDAARVRKS